jgi:hypothetical protein
LLGTPVVGSEPASPMAIPTGVCTPCAGGCIETRSATCEFTRLGLGLLLVLSRRSFSLHAADYRGRLRLREPTKERPSPRDGAHAKEGREPHVYRSRRHQHTGEGGVGKQRDPAESSRYEHHCSQEPWRVLEEERGRTRYRQATKQRGQPIPEVPERWPPVKPLHHI